MKSDEYISQNEIDEIDKIEVDKKLNRKALNIGRGTGYLLYISPAILITIYMIIYIITSN
ncbi:hypothetical protein [Clostridium sp. C2-6-12]|uniref:hypothetical protein n=1 Tax=Clostridium sp. C2-6-12 TaxID=2698832 RepID=UPI00136FCF46|nr:hypothetical protein [Clostridium sp. C2-6-12]